MALPLRILLRDYTTQDALFQYLGSQGYTGSINDRMKQYLDAQGYDGALNDQIKKGGFGFPGGLSNLEVLRLAMEEADTYLITGDSTRDNTYNQGISYYTSMLGKASISVEDNAASGQSGLDWVNETDTPNKAGAIAAIPGTGSTTVWEFSLGINDVDSGGAAIPGHGGTLDAAQIVANFKTGIDAVLAAKPDTTLFFATPVPVGSSARNDTLQEVYSLLASEYPNAYTVDVYGAMVPVYDGTDDELFRQYYFDATHPNFTGMRRVVNKILSDILPDSLLSSVVLDNSHWTGSSEIVDVALTSADIRVGEFWSTSNAEIRTNAAWACWPILEVSAGQTVRTFHNGNRDEIVYSSGGVGADNIPNTFISIDTVPDTGALPGEYEHNVVDGSVDRAGLNIRSDSSPIVGDETLQVITPIDGEGPNDFKQSFLNSGLTGFRLTAAPTDGEYNNPFPVSNAANEIVAINWDMLDPSVDAIGPNKAGNGVQDLNAIISGCQTISRSIGDYSVVANATPDPDGVRFLDQGGLEFDFDDATGALTLEAIIEINSLTGSTTANLNTIFSTRPLVDARGIILRMEDDGTLKLAGWSNAGTTLNVDSTLALTTGVPYHIVCQRENSRDWTVRVGQIGVDTTMTEFISGSQTAEIGRVATPNLSVGCSEFNTDRAASIYIAAVRLCTGEARYDNWSWAPQTRLEEYGDL